MRLQQAIEIYAIGPAQEGHSTLPDHDHPEQLLGRDKQRRGGKDKGGVQADMIQTKGKGATRFHKHKVVDRMGRVVNSFKTFKEAKRASDGNTYTTVVSNAAPTTSQPRDNKTSGEVRDMLRDNPSDNRIDEQNKIKRG